MSSDLYCTRPMRIGGKISCKPTKIRKRIISNKARYRTLSKDDVRQVLDRPVDVTGDSAQVGELIATYLNDLCTAIRSAQPIEEKDFFCCLCKRVLRCLLSDFQCIRAVTFRALRLSCHTQEHLMLLLQNRVDLFIARSLDMKADNFNERAEALKITAQMFHLYSLSSVKERTCRSENCGELGTPTRLYSNTFSFPRSLLFPVIALSKSLFFAKAERSPDVKADSLALPSLAILIELSINDPDVVIDSAGTGWIVEALTGPGVGNRRLSCLVCRVLYLWLDSPRLRTKAKLEMVLKQIFAPVIELGFFPPAAQKDGKLIGSQMQINEQLDTCAHTLLNILRSWPGLFACAATDENAKTFVSSPIGLLKYLGFGTVANPSLLKIRDLVVNTCCEFVHRPYASKTFDSWVDAVQFYSTQHYPDSYKCSLRDDFVLAEHDVILLTAEQFCHHVDLLASFRAIALFLLINAGIVQSLARLILVDPEAPMAIKATLLLSDMMFEGSSFLPLDWRLRVLSVPTLVQRACEAISQAVATTAVADDCSSDPDSFPDGFTYTNSGSGPLLLHRLDVLSKIALSRNTQPMPISNMELFVQGGRSKYLRSNSSSKFRFAKKDDQAEVDANVSEQIGNAFDSDGRPQWVNIDAVLQLLELDDSSSLFRHKYSDRCHSFFAQLLHYFSPLSGQFITNFDGDRFPVAVFSRALRLFLPLCSVEPHFQELVEGFIAECADCLTPDKLNTGVFAPKNLLNTAAMYYFAFIGAISSQKFGRELLEKTRLLQTFVDIVATTTSVEYVKLIVSCLDYSADDSLSRVALQTAVTSSIESGRKWATRFLGVLAARDVRGFSDWGMKLLLGQLADPSAKVIRHTVRLLHKWIPYYRECLPMVRNLRLEALGDAGVMLRTHLFADENFMKSNLDDTRNLFDLWKTEFNARYVDIIDEEMKITLLNVKRSLDGRFARVSNDRYEKFGVDLPIHLYGCLAMHSSGQQFLNNSGEFERLLHILREGSVTSGFAESRDVKAALFALAHFAASPSSDAINLLPIETVPLICRYAEMCPTLSVRGAAFWALNMIGGTKHGAERLASLGWESNRYTKVIEEQRLKEFRPPCLDESRLRIKCIDGRQKSVEEVIERPDDEEYPTQFGIDSLPTLAQTVDNQSPYDSPRAYDRTDLYDMRVRHSRTLTDDSAATSGFGSFPKDELGLLAREPLYSHLSDTSTELADKLRKARSPSYLPCNNTDFYANKELHFSSAVRQCFKLPPFAFGKVERIDRSLGHPIRYTYMSDYELRSCREFRQLFPRLGLDISSHSTEISTHTVTRNCTFITLPCQADLLCKNIFPKDTANAETEDFTDLAAKFEDGQLPRNVSNQTRVHRTDRCFYCSWDEETFGKKPDLSANISVVSAESRNKLLAFVELLESTRASSEKILIKMYEDWPELFSSPCIFSDVFEILSEYRFTLQSRRLLQELFTSMFSLFSNCALT